MLEARQRSTRLGALRSRFGGGLPFDANAAIVYGVVTAAVLQVGRSPRGRATDLWIAAVAISRGAALVTTQPAGFAGLEDFVEIRGV